MKTRKNLKVKFADYINKRAFKMFYMPIFAMLVIGMSVYFVGCDKDDGVILEKEKSTQISTRSLTNGQVTQEEIEIAKQLFFSQIESINNNLYGTTGDFIDVWKMILPNWNSAECIDIGGQRLVFFNIINFFDNNTYKIELNKDKNAEYSLRLFKTEKNIGTQNNQLFNGKILEITSNGFINYGILIQNSIPIAIYHSLHEEMILTNTNSSSNLEMRGGDYFDDWWYDITRGSSTGYNPEYDDDLGDNDNMDLDGEGGDRVPCDVVIGCYAPCPNGVPMSRCCHERDCSDFEQLDCNHYLNVNLAGQDCSCETIDVNGGEILEITCGSDVIEVTPVDIDNPNINIGNGGGGGNNTTSWGDIINTITNNDIDNFESCEKEMESESNMSFAQAVDFNEFLNLKADELFAVWVGHIGDALTSALKKPGDHNTNIYNTPKIVNSVTPDMSNPVDVAVQKAIIQLNENINSAGDDCSKIMSMEDFCDMLENTLNQKMKKYLENKFGVTIVSTKLINGVSFGMDDDEVLHFDLPSLDWNTASPQEKFDHIKKVLNMANLYFCETGEYEPIDWYDYIDNLPNYDTESKLSSGSCELVTFDFSNHFQSTLITDTEAQINHGIGGNRWEWGFVQKGTPNLIVLYISCEEGCSTQLHKDLFPNCE